MAADGVDSVAILINRTQAWNRKEIADALLMHVKLAFSNVSRGHSL